MALIIRVNPSSPNGAQLLGAVGMLRSALGILAELDGLHDEAIGAGAATMGSVFGVADNTQAQALSDIWEAFNAALPGAGYATLRALLNQITTS